MFFSPRTHIAHLVAAVVAIGMTLVPVAGAQELPVPVPLEPQAIIVQTVHVPDGDVFTHLGPTLQSFTPMYSTIGGGGSEMPLANLMQLPQIRSELELVDDQWKTIQKLQADYSRKLRKASQAAFNGGKIDRLAMAEMQERRKALQEDFETKLKEALLPHQFTRLKQVGLHTQMQRGATNALLSEKLADELEISDEQQQRIKEKSAEVAKRLAKQIAELKKQAQDEVLDELTSSQRKKLNELLGDEFRPR